MKKIYLLTATLIIGLICCYSNLSAQKSSTYITASSFPDYNGRSATGSVFDKAPNLKLDKITIGYTDLEVYDYTDYYYYPYPLPYYSYGLKTGYNPDGSVYDYNDAYYTPDKKGDPTGTFDVIWHLSGLPDNLFLYPLVSEFYNCEFVQLIPGGVRLRYKLDHPQNDVVEFRIDLVNDYDYNECVMLIGVKYLNMLPIFE